MKRLFEDTSETKKESTKNTSPLQPLKKWHQHKGILAIIILAVIAVSVIYFALKKQSSTEVTDDVWQDGIASFTSDSYPVQFLYPKKFRPQTTDNTTMFWEDSKSNDCSSGKICIVSNMNIFRLKLEVTNSTNLAESYKNSDYYQQDPTFLTATSTSVISGEQALMAKFCEKWEGDKTCNDADSPIVVNILHKGQLYSFTFNAESDSFRDKILNSIKFTK